MAFHYQYPCLLLLSNQKEMRMYKGQQRCTNVVHSKQNGILNNMIKALAKKYVYLKFELIYTYSESILKRPENHISEVKKLCL